MTALPSADAAVAPALALERVTIHYDDVLAVDEVSFSVGVGEWVALIGPNGAGKSSLLRAVTGQLRHHGEILESGVPTRSMSWRERARRTALVPQQPELPAAMAVLDYVLLGRTPHIGYLGNESVHDVQVCQTLLQRLRLGRFADRPIATLSGGEIQRAVLARALAQEAPVLLLDEPTSALDLGRRVEALELVDALRHERALTVLSVMHDLTLAAQFADRLVLLVDGTVRASGAPAQVLDPAVLAESYGARVRVLTGEDGRLIVVPQRADAGRTG